MNKELIFKYCGWLNKSCMCSADMFDHCAFDGNCPLRGYDWKLLNEDYPLDSNDMIAAKDKMVEKGDWIEFYDFADTEYLKLWNHCLPYEPSFTAWLFHPNRFFELMSEALEKGVIKA